MNSMAAVRPFMVTLVPLSEFGSRFPLKSLALQICPVGGVFARAFPLMVTQLPGLTVAPKLAPFTTDRTCGAAGEGDGAGLIAAVSHESAERRMSRFPVAPARTSVKASVPDMKTRPFPTCAAARITNGPFGSPGCCVGIPEGLLHSAALVSPSDTAPAETDRLAPLFSYSAGLDPNAGWLAKELR